MKMEKGHRWGQWLAIALMVALAAVLPGCGKMSEKVPGIWKSAEAKDGKHDYVEIGANYVVIEEERIEGAVLEDKDTSVWVKTPFSGDKALMVLVINDDDTMTCQISLGILGGKSQKMVRSTAEERSAELTPPLIAFRGFAKATGKLDGMAIDELWEIGDDYVCRDSLRLPAKLVSAKRAYTLTLNPDGNDKNTLTFHATSAANDEFACSGYDTDLRLKKMSADDGAKLRQKIEKEQSLDHILGFYKTMEAFPTIWEIANDHITIGTDKCPATIVFSKRMADIGYTARTNGAITDGKMKYDANLQINGQKQIWQFVVQDGKVYRLAENGLGQIELIRISAEDAKALREQQEKQIAEKKALLEKIKGHWLALPVKPEACKDFCKEERAYPLIITSDDLIANNTKGNICMEVRAGEAVFRYNPQKYHSYSNQMYIVKSLSEDGTTMRVIFVHGRNTEEIEYQRMKETEEDKIRNPELKGFFGKWVLENASCETFKTLDISLSAISFDGEKHPITKFSRNGCGVKCNVQFSRGYAVANYVILRNLPGGKIAVGYAPSCDGNYDYNEWNIQRNIGYYHKATDDEYSAALAQTTKSPLKAMAGYWKSDETKIGDHKWLVYGQFNYAASTNPDNDSPTVSLNLVVCRSQYGEKPYEIVDWCNQLNPDLYACLIGGDTGAKVYYMNGYFNMYSGESWNDYSIQIIDGNSLKLINAGHLNNLVLKRADKKDMGPYFKKYPE